MPNDFHTRLVFALCSGMFDAGVPLTETLRTIYDVPLMDEEFSDETGQVSEAMDIARKAYGVGREDCAQQMVAAAFTEGE